MEDINGKEQYDTHSGKKPVPKKKIKSEKEKQLEQEKNHEHGASENSSISPDEKVEDPLKNVDFASISDNNLPIQEGQTPSNQIERKTFKNGDKMENTKEENAELIHPEEEIEHSDDDDEDEDSLEDEASIEVDTTDAYQSNIEVKKYFFQN